MFHFYRSGLSGMLGRQTNGVSRATMEEALALMYEWTSHEHGAVSEQIQLCKVCWRFEQRACRNI